MGILGVRRNRPLAAALILLLSVGVFALMPAAGRAAVGDLALASSTQAGESAVGECNEPAVSATGRYVAFASSAKNLPGANDQIQVYRKDLSTGEVRLASATQDGEAGKELSRWPAISGDGRYVAFQSMASNFPDGGGSWQVYRKDMVTGAMTLASADDIGKAGDAGGEGPSMSADGRYVAFASNSSNFPPPADFSTKVTCLESMAIAVDRTMEWTGPGAASPEGHSSIGVTSPAKQWYMPEGSTDWGFECWLLIQNPNPTEATCTVTYMTEKDGAVVREKKVPAFSRKTYNVADDIGSKDASIQVSSDVTVIPERSMYRHNRREGHDSIGTTAQAKDYYLAEGTSAWGFTTFVCVQNPNPDAANVQLTYMTKNGAVPQPWFSMPGNSRKTIRVNDALPNTDFSTRVHSDKPIIAERAMYWDNGTGEACHDSIGMSAPAETFYLPDGQSSDGRETWTCVQNPNGSAVQVTVTYLPAGGGTPVSFTETMPGNTRKSYNMADKGITGRAAVLVQSKEDEGLIMVERAMYWNGRGAGTATIGGFVRPR